MLNMPSTDTIIALSTPPGYSGIAAIRLSGGACLNAGGGFLKNISNVSGRMTHGQLKDPATGEVVDDLTFCFLSGPGTYTGEDMLEIFPHGSPLLCSKIIDMFLTCDGVRMANPGEFTRRALEAGKLDMMQAESVAQIIHAKSHDALRNSQKMLSGEMREDFDKITSLLRDLSCNLELEVDFVEEEIQPDYKGWEQRIVDASALLKKICLTWERGKMLRNVPRVVVFGEPNAGKSSFINAVLSTDRLLVSPTPGTTRDYVEVTVNLPGGEVQFIDTAGLGVAANSIEERAMQKTRTLIDEGDYKILLADGTTPVSELGNENQCDLKILTKSDLNGFEEKDGYISISNLTGQGIGGVIERLNNNLFINITPAMPVFLSTKRQYHCVKNAIECLERALVCLQENPAVEILAFEIRLAHQALKELIGEYKADDVLDQVFSDFCIGK